jgi:peptidoglycan/xylan/chitin deacetylase (PgdA/CDA1 family)
MPTSFQLSLPRQLEEFRPELEYACRFVSQCHPVTLVESMGVVVIHYGPNPPAGAVHIPNSLFPKGVIIDDDGIYPNTCYLRQLESGKGDFPVLPVGLVGLSRIGRTFEYDALGLIFLMLSRLEERNNVAVKQDRYNRFPFDASLQARCGSLDIPYADIAAKHLAGAILETPEPECLTKYNVILTHDVDRLHGFDTKKYLAKIVLGDIIFRKSIKLASHRLWDALASGEPWRSCRYVMRLLEHHGFKGHFYFMGPTEHKMDNPYVIKWPDKVRRLTEEIVSRGHRIGFHPGAATLSNKTEWDRQRAGLENIIGMKVTEGRQHALIFDIGSTWDIWDEAGMKNEMTLGYPAPSGFRSGTCRSHAIFSLRQRRELSMRSYPTAIMDFGFFGGKYRDMPLNNALEECQHIIDVCKKWQGDLVVLFHPSQLTKVRRDFFEQLLERL